VLSPRGCSRREMGKAARAKKAPPPSEPSEIKKTSPEGKVMQPAERKQMVAEKEAKFMAALQRFVGPDVELTEDKVREVIQTLTPEQRQELMSEGQDLKEELLTGDGHDEEVALFRKEVNDRAEKADLPVEKDGEHLTKKVLSFMQGSSDAMPVANVLEAVASCPYLVKLALAEARETAHKAEPADLAAIEGECLRLKVEGWRDGEAVGRPPFVRRNLLLVCYQMHQARMCVHLQPNTMEALVELCTKVRRLLDMLFKFCLQNRWVKAALAVTECQALVLNGLWDAKEDECREAMRQRMASGGLKLPKLALVCAANDCRPGQKVAIKVEISRAHAYSEDEMKAYKATLREGEDAREGWWVIAESIRTKPNTKYQPGEEISHNSLVGRQPLGCALDAPTVACELEFEAPTTPGEYKIMVHVRSSGCVGVDVRRKVSFTVLKALPANATSSSSGASSGDPVETGDGGDRIEGDELPPPLERAEAAAAAADRDGPPPLTADAPVALS